MPNNSARANGEAMPKINRRNFLRTSVAASAAVASVPIATTACDASEMSPDIEAAFNSVINARRELVAAKDARDWLADEWRHLWPRAPESMRWHDFMSGAVEMDIVDRSFLGEDGYAIKIKSRKEVAESKAWAEGGRAPRANASAKMKERHEKWLRERRAEVAEMEAYLDETERLREISGSRAILARIEEARLELDRAISTLMAVPVANLVDLRVKAQAALIAADVAGFSQENAQRFPILGASFDVVLDVIALAEGGEA
jgi:hypothetical protein